MLESETSQSSSINFLFYPQTYTYGLFPMGTEITPTLLESFFKPEKFLDLACIWKQLGILGTNAIEVYPDFPWWEAIYGFRVQSTSEGYKLYLSSQIGKMGEANESWFGMLINLLEKASCLINSKTRIAIPPFLGYQSLLTLFYKINSYFIKEKYCAEKMLFNICEKFIFFYRKVLSLTKLPPYIAGGSFIQSSDPFLVCNEPFFSRINHFLNVSSIKILHEKLQKELSCSLYLSLPIEVIRWADPLTDFNLFQGIIIERNQYSPSWNDLIPLLHKIQEIGKTLILAGPLEIEDWKSAFNELKHEGLIILLKTPCLQEAKKWFEYLKKKINK